MLKVKTILSYATFKKSREDRPLSPFLPRKGKREGKKDQSFPILFKKLLISFLIIPFFSFGTISFAAFAGSGEPPEYKMKAVFIYNFAKFVDWPAGKPPNSEKNLSVCVLGDDPFGSNLNVIKGKTIRGRTVENKAPVKIENAKDCDCLFISDSEKSSVAKILEDLKDHDVLTISDMDGFLEAGGIIQFVIDKSKVRFLINMVAAKEAGFKVSSKLLELAKGIKK